MQQEVVLAILAKEPSHGYQLRARLGEALGPLGDAAKLLRCEPAPRGHRAAAAGGPALAGGLRGQLDRPEEYIMTDTGAG